MYSLLNEKSDSETRLLSGWNPSSTIFQGSTTRYLSWTFGIGVSGGACNWGVAKGLELAAKFTVRRRSHRPERVNAAYLTAVTSGRPAPRRHHGRRGRRPPRGPRTRRGWIRCARGGTGRRRASGRRDSPSLRPVGRTCWPPNRLLLGREPAERGRRPGGDTC